MSAKHKTLYLFYLDIGKLDDFEKSDALLDWIEEQIDSFPIDEWGKFSPPPNISLYAFTSDDLVAYHFIQERNMDKFIVKTIKIKDAFDSKEEFGSFRNAFKLLELAIQPILTKADKGEGRELFPLAITVCEYEYVNLFYENIDQDWAEVYEKDSVIFALIFEIATEEMRRLLVESGMTKLYAHLQETYSSKEIPVQQTEIQVDLDEFTVLMRYFGVLFGKGKGEG